MEASLSRNFLQLLTTDIIGLFSSAFVGLGTMLLTIPGQAYVGQLITKVQKVKMDCVSVAAFLSVLPMK